MSNAEAMIHSLKAKATVTIIHENGNNDVVAEYEGKRYTAVFNVFTWLYYVDNILRSVTEPEALPELR
jgi:hypothetical protein